MWSTGRLFRTQSSCLCDFFSPPKKVKGNAREGKKQGNQNVCKIVIGRHRVVQGAAQMHLLPTFRSCLSLFHSKSKSSGPEKMINIGLLARNSPSIDPPVQATPFDFGGGLRGLKILYAEILRVCCFVP